MKAMRMTGVGGALLVGTLLTGILAAVPALAEDTVEEAAANLPNSPIYNKPFLVRGSTAIGGYMDMEFKADKTSTFDQHRFVPFIYAAVSDRVHVASEIEFEHGGFVSGSDQTDGEIKIEFATMDITAVEALHVRAGIVLSPVGRLNVYHDAPMLDLTDRPIVTRYVIPTTLSESGMGLFGTFYPSEVVVLTYEAYAVNGFNGDSVDPVTGELTLRDGRGSQKKDNNNSRSFVGRFAVSPRLGTEIGVSLHTGKYDDDGNHNLTLAALDAIFATGAWEFVGEVAMATAGYTPYATTFATAQNASAVADATAENWGTYLEARYHFLPGAIKALPMSVFTAVFRGEYVDRDQNVTGRDVQRGTFGINFRITEETVIKNDLQLTRERDGGVTEWADTETGYRLSFATYF